MPDDKTPEKETKVEKPTKVDAAEPKVLDVKNIEDAKAKIPDIQVVGNGDAWQLLSKASSKSGGWMKSSKALVIPGYGVVLQVSTQQGTNVAESLVAIPNVKIVDDVNGGKKLIA